MSRFKKGLWKGVCLAVVVPGLMALATPMRSLVLEESTADAAEEALASDAAMVHGTVTSGDSVPLPDVTVTGSDQDGNILAMAQTGPDGDFQMELPAKADNVVVTPEGGQPTDTEVEAGKAVEVDSTVPAPTPVDQASWWSGMSTTKKAAIIGAPVAASAGVGFALSDDDSDTQTASPIVPE